MDSLLALLQTAADSSALDRLLTPVNTGVVMLMWWRVSQLEKAVSKLDVQLAKLTRLVYRFQKDEGREE